MTPNGVHHGQQAVEGLEGGNRVSDSDASDSSIASVAPMPLLDASELNDMVSHPPACRSQQIISSWLARHFDCR